MCLIIRKPADIQIPQDILSASYDYNPHGMGVMYYDGKEVKVEKIMPRDLKDVLEFYNKFSKSECAFHMRLKTRGAIDEDMIHPFEVLPPGKDFPGLYLMHNGTLTIKSIAKKTLEENLDAIELPKGKALDDLSDSWLFSNVIVKNMLEKDPTLLQNPFFVEMISQYVGSNNKILFLGGAEPTFTTINESTGTLERVKGAWLSNTYSITKHTPVANYYQKTPDAWGSGGFYKPWTPQDTAKINGKTVEDAKFKDLPKKTGTSVVPANNSNLAFPIKYKKDPVPDPLDNEEDTLENSEEQWLINTLVDLGYLGNEIDWYTALKDLTPEGLFTLVCLDPESVTDLLVDMFQVEEDTDA